MKKANENKMNLNKSILLLVSAFVFLMLIPAALALSCGDTITSSVTLSGDLLNCGNGLTISGSGITLDCAGYTISGNGGGTGVNVGTSACYYNQNNVIKNCIITNFNKGIITRDYYGSFINNTIDSNTGDGFFMAFGGGCGIGDKIINNTIISNGNDGINFDNFYGGRVITGNRIALNGVFGLSVGKNNDGMGPYDKVYNNLFNQTNAVYTYYPNAFFLNTTKTLGTNIVGGSYLGGNFWANPAGNGFSQTCIDTDSDGICESVYDTSVNCYPVSCNIYNNEPTCITHTGCSWGFDDDWGGYRCMGSTTDCSKTIFDYLPLTAPPIPISSCEELQDMNLDLAGDYYLTQDIECSATSGWNGGAGFAPVGDNINQFTGTFDGQNHTISDLYIDNYPAGYPYNGLFGYSSGEIKNIGLIGGSVEGTYAGGLAGENRGTISNCYSTAFVGGPNSIGGLVGQNFGTISASYSAGSVRSGSNAGGLVGGNDGTISNSYSTASVSGSGPAIGGLVGYNSGGTILNSYATGSGSYGGLVALGSGTFINSFWDIEISGTTYSVGGTGKTTAQMKQQSTFIGWDFTNIWNINEGITYPFLRWQVPAAQDADSDSVADGIDNCVNDYNPDQHDIDGTEGGDVCDACPACSGTCCIEQYSSAESVNSSGATITIQQDSVLDIPANALTNDKSISITKGTGSNFEICMPQAGECGIVVADYTIGPTGQTFNQDYTLKLSYGSREECSWGACEIWYSDDNGITWSNPWGPPAIEGGFLVISANHFSEYAIVATNYSYVKNATVVIDSYDDESGVADTGYCIDSDNTCVPEIIYSEPIFIDEIGTHYVRYQIYDNAGNVAPVKVKKITIIESCDSEPPIIEIITEGVMGNDSWFVSVVNWTIRAIDNISGIKSLDYSVEKS